MLSTLLRSPRFGSLSFVLPPPSTNSFPSSQFLFRPRHRAQQRNPRTLSLTDQDRSTRTRPCRPPYMRANRLSNKLKGFLESRDCLLGSRISLLLLHSRISCIYGSPFLIALFTSRRIRKGLSSLRLFQSGAVLIS
ncbi:hypothetical protein CPC08DRAFT_246644 [Agrocybe pediades]|nr:hypothetical protein CPC08DRAFT_246644 [Agrocybe pediades]